MKKYYLILQMILAALLCSTPAFSQIQDKASEEDLISMDNPRKVRLMTIDSAGKAFLGEEVAENLTKVRKIEAFKLEHFLAEEAQAVSILQGFTILDTAEITTDQQGAIASILTSPEAYIQDKNIKNLCLFTPDMAFALMAKEQTVFALVSLNCKMTRFYFPSEDREDFNYITFNIREDFQGFDDIYNDIFGQKTLKVKAKNSLFEARSNDDLLVKKQAKPIYYTVEKGEGWSHVAQYATEKLGKKVTQNEVVKLNYAEFNNTDPMPMLHVGDKVIVGYFFTDNGKRETDNGQRSTGNGGGRTGN